MKMNKSSRVRVRYELQQVRVFIHGFMQIPDRLSRVVTTSCLLNRFMFNLLLRLSRENTSDDFILVNSLVHSRDISMLLNEMSLGFGCTMKKQRCLFIVLCHIELNQIQYARKSIYHVFLVYMGKSNPRASCSKAVTLLASSLLHYALGIAFPIHTRNTWNIRIVCIINLTYA